MSFEDDAYDLAVYFAESGCVPTCVPVIDEDARESVAVVSLDPNAVALIALTHPSGRVRARALTAVAMKAHDVLADRGLIFDARYSP